jgi:transformer-2 protein
MVTLKTCVGAWLVFTLKVVIIYDRRTGESKRFGFVYFKHQEDAIKAKEGLSGLVLHGNEVRIDYSITRRAYSPTPGRYMGKTK